MKRTLFFSVPIVLTCFLAGCDDPTPEEEVDKICDCMQKAESAADMAQCRERMQRISDRYAFDPEAAEAIKKRLRECATE